MRTVLLVCMLAVMATVVCGCISTAEQARLNDLTAEQREKVDALIAERVAAYLLVEKQTTEIKKKIDAGTVTIDDGKKYIELLRSEMAATVEKIERQIKDTKESYRSEQNRTIEGGSSKAEYYGGVALAVILNFLGINAYRNRKHPLSKEMT